MLYEVITRQTLERGLRLLDEERLSLLLRKLFPAILLLSFMTPMAFPLI